MDKLAEVMKRKAAIEEEIWFSEKSFPPSDSA
jgi:hypothetical protein